MAPGWQGYQYSYWYQYEFWYAYHYECEHWEWYELLSIIYYLFPIGYSLWSQAISYIYIYMYKMTIADWSIVAPAKSSRTPVGHQLGRLASSFLSLVPCGPLRRPSRGPPLGPSSAALPRWPFSVAFLRRSFLRPASALLGRSRYIRNIKL